jgi:DNA-binding response OmpR family regulator
MTTTLSRDNARTRILVVEDDPHILLGLEEILKSEGYDVCVCSRGDKALDALSRERPGLVILDVMLPGMSGFDLCRQIRAKKIATPILMLTAKGQEMDKVIGLDLGADDYMTKPFGVRELVARIHALLRRATSDAGAARAGSGTGSAKQPFSDAPFRIGTVTIDPKRFELKRGKSTEELTARELKLLQLFHACPGEVLSRDRLLNDVWGYGYYGTTRTLDQVIVQLRKKLGDSGDEPKHLLTVHGVGYKMLL